MRFPIRHARNIIVDRGSLNIYLSHRGYDLTSAKAGATTSTPAIVTSSDAPRLDPSAFARKAVTVYVPFASDGSMKFPDASVVVLAAGVVDPSGVAVIVTPATVLSGAAFELVTLPLITADAGGGGFDNSGNNISMRRIM